MWENRKMISLQHNIFQFILLTFNFSFAQLSFLASEIVIYNFNVLTEEKINQLQFSKLNEWVLLKIMPK